MSAYITFYIRSRSGGPYIELESWSRSTPIFQQLQDRLKWESFRRLETDDLIEAIDGLQDEIKSYRKQLTFDRRALKFLQGASLAADELIDKYSDYQQSIEESRNLIEKNEMAISSLQTYLEILETHAWFSADYAAGGELFIAFECDPNHSEEKEND